MSPWLSNSAVTMDLLQEAGYRYVMDWTMDDQPVWLRTRKGRILAVPYPIEVNDTRGIVWYRYTADEFADMIVDQFDEMLAQSAGQPLVCPISLHPSSSAGRTASGGCAARSSTSWAHGDRVWLTRPRDICAHIESLPARGRARVGAGRPFPGSRFRPRRLPCSRVPMKPARWICRSSPASS